MHIQYLNEIAIYQCQAGRDEKTTGEKRKRTTHRIGFIIAPRVVEL